MFAKQFRLPRHSTFPRQSFRSPLFLMRFGKNALSSSRFGFVVSKKVDKRAVVRNHTKRVFRSLVEEEFSNITSGNDVLFVLSPMVKATPRAEMKKQLLFALSKAGLRIPASELSSRT